MPLRPPCQTAEFFVLRSPGLPLDALSSQGPDPFKVDSGCPPAPCLEQDREALRQVLRGLVRREEVREALALASPDLASRLEPWLAGSLDGPAARNMERALLKYLSRMSSRATPFGLFAGVSMGTWGPASHLSLGAWREGRKALRLDWGVLETLVEGFEREPEVREGTLYRPNTSLYARGGWYRYLERRDQGDGQGRTYHLEAVEGTPHLDFVLQRARDGAQLEELTTGLVRRLAVEPTVARAFLDQLIDAQVLCGDLPPSLTSPDPLGQVVAALQARPATAAKAEELVALAADLRLLQDARLGSFPGGYAPRLAALADLGLPPETRDVVQVDVFRPSPGLALAPGVRRALEEGVDLLRRLSPVAPEGPLDRFRAAFQERYGPRWMPLLEVLDEESGLGFDGGTPLDSPLLEGLPFRGPSPARSLTGRDQVLLQRFPRWEGRRVWDLDEADVEALANPDPQPFPAAFSALASLAASDSEALDRGDFRFWMEAYSGPTAARWLGRFASGDLALKEALERHLKQEEAAQPEAVFAEVVHVPEGRMGNVLARPALRAHEIPFLATSGRSGDHRIEPSDLRVTVWGNRIWLASARLHRQVIPRLSSAHNFARGPVVYRFLAHLQDQDGHSGGWSWGALGDLPFLPRVARGRHVLAKARWRMDAKEVKAAMQASSEGAWGAIQALRAGRGLPRFVQLTDADNFLRVDLDQALWVEALYHLISSRSSFILTECFPEPEQAPVTSDEGRFAHELVLPFESRNPGPKPGPLPAMPQDTPIRAFPPGSEWLYLKLYCGPASADRLLVELAPLLRGTSTKGLWDRWHFVRYRDPEHHVRLRFHGPPERLVAELLPLVHTHLEEGLANGLLWKWQVDTFEPEWERYAGPVGLALAEAGFHDDSQSILDQLVDGLTLEQRWRAGLRNVDAIWAALGLDLHARKSLAQASRDGFRKEFADGGEGAVQMGRRFRDLRKELEQGFPWVSGPPFPPQFSSLTRIREASDRGLLQGELPRLAGNLSHMHLNRLLRRDHRETEWVLMEFLVRLYESRLARAPEN